MDDKVKHIIESGLLEAYFLGLTDDTQSREIELLLERNPELHNRQEAFDDLLFDMTGAISKVPPLHLKNQIREAVKNENGFSSSTTQTDDKVEKSILAKWFPIAASILLLTFAWVAYSNFHTSKDLSAELAQVRKDLKIQKIQNLEMSSQLSKLADEFAFINDSHTKKMFLQGNQKAQALKMSAYWNAELQKSMVSVEAFPSLNANECLQMWADVDGEMLSVGILNPNQIYSNIDFLKNATSLNITIEPKGGSEHPNVRNLVASVLL